ncbi:MAG TPA: DUF2889 domain-containing protein, partial [Acidimicrobiales bacterium]
MPDVPPTLADLRPSPESGESPVHRRTIDVQVFERDGFHVVIGTLHDQRPWATGDLGPRDLHHMELGIVVRRADLVIVDARATMGTFPHAECPSIEGAFGDLAGLSVSRGYTNAVQTRFGRERGCSHIEFLARALGPVVIQAITSSAAMRLELGDGEQTIGGDGALGWLTNTCHIWAEDGVGPQKVATGWRPGIAE